MPRVLKIGLVAPFEGTYRSSGYDAIYAARLAIAEINAAGGANGWQLELVAYDDRADAQNARTIAQNLSIDEDVVAVIGHYHQTSMVAAVPIYTEAHLPLLAIGGWLIPTPTNVWQLSPSPEVLATDMLAIATLPSDAIVDVWGEDALAHMLTAQLTAAGYQLATTVTPQQERPDVIFTTLVPHIAAERLIQWQAAGWEGQLIGTRDLASPTFATIVSTVNADLAKGPYIITAYPFPQDVSDTVAWRNAYQAVGPHVPAPSLYALPTYEAVHLLAQAIAVVAPDTPTRTSVAAALFDVQREGLLGPITWDANGFWAAPQIYGYHWKNGDWHRLP